MKPTQPASPGKTLVIVALAALLPMAAGLVATLYSVEHTLQRETDKVLKSALAQLDQVFDQVATSALHLYPLHVANCQPNHPFPALPSGRNVFVDEFKLVGDCAAQLDFPGTAGNESVWTLSIEPPAPASDDLGYLHMRYGNEHQHMVALMDIQRLAQWMKMISGDTYLSLRIGGYQMWDDGALLYGKTTDSQRYASTAKSSSWPYEVTSTLSADDILRAFRDGLIEMLVKLGALSVVCAGLCHWALTRTRP
ncbi:MULTISPECIES: hypothetical protein [unclassified Pseudomonas]|uniref:hypothetical protein n=1 Tax=unclassified Pseudomonas TaxID=196821 RepID=UPI000BD03E6B|nr:MULTISPECIES: hypothetical protein [unclassified Pseudomonas]PVZ19827.1 hypothetical protein F474_00417 [Pseudomonas sp. URIL14HWK12:I12]PVZ26893.1 hypothetical protein F470_00072 [Pseudomonas sp. URIL14HWK12:I10]PVZ37782.1 hypothetical protein F472_00417 [Pseudomonas sp. URIL14HWK12:I11]SNZ05690.1 hypothetical protein SAMN05660463_00987 [Pseudomonas sp. URIL14HWK12:I9]